MGRSRLARKGDHLRLKKTKVAVAALLAMGGLPALLTLTTPLAADAAGGTRMISAGGTASMIASQPGSDAIQGPEIRAAKAEPAATAAVPGPEVGGTDVAGLGSPSSTPALTASFDGLNHRNQRLANGGNQFSVEPPDQGLCAGNGFVFETVNTVLRVFDTAGNPLTGVVDQNTFYGYDPAINRTTGVQGPFVTDPSCLYDSDTNRWFHVVLTLEVNAAGDFTGVNHLDLAVSNSGDPTGTWTIYRLPVQDDGSAGTPDHGCSGANGVGHGPCIGDYPHIGADRNGFYITTNEYSFFGPEFKAAQVYAFDKRALAAGTPDVAVTQIDTTGMGPGGESGFTVWPAVGRGGGDDNRSGTEYFMSSDAASEVNASGSSSRIGVWALTNTRSLRTDTPNLTLRNRFLPVGTYTVPPKAPQKPGDHPLGECIADNSIKTPFGTGCWNRFFVNGGPFNGDLAPIDTNDSRMQQVTYANGRLWSALDTGVTVGGENRAGVEWFIVKVGDDGPLNFKVSNSGYIAVEGNDVAYPAVGVTSSGKGVVAMTLMGNDYYPSAAYASIDKSGAGDIQIAAAGLGPQDGFTNYAAFVGDPPRERWGDYGAAVADGKNVWIASEYIGQTCTLAQYLTPPIGSCGATRTSLANWGTRISQITP
jgi:hypothetical protein